MTALLHPRTHVAVQPQFPDIIIPAGTHPAEVRALLALDRDCINMGRCELATHSVERYRRQAADAKTKGLTWLAGRNEDRADELETDARLAAANRTLVSLRAAGTDGNGVMLLGRYIELVHAAVERAKREAA